ncbi:hypothetical protein [Enterococcus sp. 5H]|uniref:hypothetical protein n=1 Tax=Enterococcus sp. 5H TaxID=1229490 RepID=UPI0023049E87|nr:hypothetical protein [Enterococcus sp. 5H]MDA9471964.1 hypothetical protein [Enterococcus sp. 5H]
MNYLTTTDEQEKIKNIRSQYLTKGEDKVLQLKKLDRKVKLPAKVTAGIVGVGGTLLMGAGMSTIMVWDNMFTGLAMAIPGMLVAILSRPLYSMMLKRRKQRYTEEIMMLTDELLDQN